MDYCQQRTMHPSATQASGCNGGKLTDACAPKLALITADHPNPIGKSRARSETAYRSLSHRGLRGRPARPSPVNQGFALALDIAKGHKQR